MKNFLNTTVTVLGVDKLEGGFQRTTTVNLCPIKGLRKRPERFHHGTTESGGES